MVIKILITLIFIIALAIAVYRVYKRSQARRWWKSHVNHYDGSVHDIIEYMPKTTKEDKLARAQMYDLILNDTQQAYQAYSQLVETLDASDAFYIDKIQDFNSRIQVFDRNYEGRSSPVDLPTVEFTFVPIEVPEIHTEENIINAFTYKSDTENVHDSAVTNRTRETLELLRATTPRSGATLEDVFRSCGDRIPSGFQSAMKYATNCVTYGCTDQEAFLLVWDRINVPENSEKREDLLEEFINAMKGSIEGGASVCVNGKIVRFVESLTMLDYDPKVGGAISLQDIRKAVLEESQTMMTEELKRIEENKQLYNDILNDVDNESTIQWKHTVIDKIDSILLNYTDLNETNRQSTKDLVLTALDLR